MSPWTLNPLNPLNPLNLLNPRTPPTGRQGGGADSPNPPFPWTSFHSCPAAGMHPGQQRSCGLRRIEKGPKCFRKCWPEQFSGQQINVCIICIFFGVYSQFHFFVRPGFSSTRGRARRPPGDLHNRGGSASSQIFQPCVGSTALLPQTAEYVTKYLAFIDRCVAAPAALR